MKPYNCYVSIYVDGKLTNSTHNACWSMLRGPNLSFGKRTETFSETEIFISDFETEETKKYQRFLVLLINKITPCSIVKIGQIRYIKYKMLKGKNEYYYDRNLIILNFIRNLWHEPVSGYSVKFFEFLKESRKYYKDPVSRLTWANKKAIEGLNSVYSSIGHSNYHNHNLLKIKTTKQLLEKNFVYTRDFLLN